MRRVGREFSEEKMVHVLEPEGMIEDISYER